MNAGLADPPIRAPRWRRTLSVIRRRSRYMPAVELLTLLLAIGIGVGSYFLLEAQPGSRPLTPPLVALLLIANLEPAIALLELWGGRVAKRSAA
jgi:two-component system nitrogen regulation sensor histidine kinase NtrY